MELILLACSNRKLAGGEKINPQLNVKDFLNNSSFEQLLKLRREISQRLPLEKVGEPGIDLGNVLSKDITYLPAFKRYTGIVYERGQVARLYPTAKNCRILIVSGLYGLLDASDWIRNYNVEMTDRSSSGVEVKKFWSTHYLHQYIAEYFLYLKPSLIHDLLPLGYRKALGPHLPFSLLIEGYKEYNFPGEGNGSQWRRGDIVRNILKQHQ